MIMSRAIKRLLRGHAVQVHHNYFMFCFAKDKEPSMRQRMTGWLVDHILVDLRNGFQWWWWASVSCTMHALLKFWFINSHPFSLFICAQSLHLLVFPACSRHLLNLKWITSPAKQRISFDLQGFTDEQEEIWANSVAILNLLLHHQPVIHWNASIVLLFYV
jgi:hypothetical protein